MYAIRIGRTLSVLLSIAAVSLVLHSTRGHAQNYANSASERASDVLESEELIETLRAPLQTLSESALNLRLPTERAATVFTSDVEVTDLVESSLAQPHEILQLDVAKWSWPVAEQKRSVKVSDMAFWSEFLETVDFFHHAKFYTVRGSFEGEAKDQFRAKSGFKGLAQLKSGELAWIKAGLTIVWTVGSEAEGSKWRIAEVHTRSFDLIESERPLFSDVLGSALDEADRSRARESTRDEILIEWVQGIKTGKTNLDESVAGIMDALRSGTYHMHMSHVCVVDIDRDGFDDLYVCPSNATPMFFRARGDGTFEEIAEDLGLAHDQVEAAIFADFDNDGDSDAFLSFFPEETRYFQNESGHFEEQDAAIDGQLPHLVVAMSPMDYNNDGLMDIYFIRYNGIYVGAMAAELEDARARGESVKASFPGMSDTESQELYRLLFDDAAEPFVNRPGPPNMLFENKGNGRFARAENCEPVEQYTQSMSATWSDIDLDGDMDLYIVTEAAPNNLIRNNGDGSFTDITDGETADVGFGMGLAWGDYDNDGRQDFYVTNMYSKAGQRISSQMNANEYIAQAARGNSLLRNGSDGFKRVSGVSPGDIQVEAADFGWGGAFADFNNDGNLDLYAPAGYVSMPSEVAAVGES